MWTSEHGGGVFDGPSYFFVLVVVQVRELRRGHDSNTVSLGESSHTGGKRGSMDTESRWSKRKRATVVVERLLR